jgi:hypothetical protein
MIAAGEILSAADVKATAEHRRQDIDCRGRVAGHSAFRRWG